MMNNHTPPLRLAVLICLIATALSRADATTLDLFTAGQGGYAHYRIPGIVVTPGGALLAYCEARASLGGDWGKTDLLLRRSTDGGRIWEPARPLAKAPMDSIKNPIAIEQKLGAPGEITMNNPTAITDGPGGKSVHVLYCVEYGRCFYIRSDDDGVTFTEPREITPVFGSFRKSYPWRVIAAGPGNGIRLSKTGRLVVPVWLSTGAGGHGHRPSCVATIYSDDHGQTWRAGDIVVSHPKLTNPSETAIAELSDGRIMLNIRHEGDGGPTWRAIVVGPNGATGWSEPRLDRALPDPVCMASLLSVGRGRLLFANPANDKTRDRKNLTLRMSRDDGRTWPDARVIERGTSGYSDLAASHDGRTIFCFYERGVADKSRPRGVGALTLARLDLDRENGR